MMKTLRSGMLLALAAVVIAGQPARAQFAVYDAAAFTQREAQNLQVVTQLVNQFTSLENQLNAIKAQAQTLGSLGANPNLLVAAQQQIANLNQAMSAVTGVNYASANLSTQFGKVFPGFTQSSSYAAQHQQQVAATLAQEQQALLAAGYTASDVSTSASTAQSLENILNTPGINTVAAIQAASKIALLGVTEAQKTRQLLATEQSAQTTYLAQKTSNQEASDAAARNFLAPGSVPSPAPTGT
jgi:P-type conjugative transfer protein TrbJ